MSQKNLCVYGKNGKRLGGGAAQLKRIKDCGGWDAYHKELISRVTEKVYEEVEYSNAIVHAFQGFRAPFSGKIVHIFPEQSAAFN